MIGILILLISILLVLTDLIVVITANKLYAGSFIRRMRYFVYSITPARYIFIMIVFGIIVVKADFGFQNMLIIEAILLSGMLLTYSERLLTHRQKQKRRISAKRTKLLSQKKG